MCIRDSFKDGLYREMGRHADCLAGEIRSACADRGYPLYVPNTTNQIFPVIPDAVLESWKDKYTYTYQCRVDSEHSAVRFCTCLLYTSCPVPWMPVIGCETAEKPHSISVRTWMKI